MNHKKYSNTNKLEDKQELERRYRQNYKSRLALQSNKFSFDDFVLCLILMLVLLLWDILGSAF